MSHIQIIETWPAIDLGIAKASVLTYRKRAYQRLHVSSPYELCALVTY